MRRRAGCGEQTNEQWAHLVRPVEARHVPSRARPSETARRVALVPATHGRALQRHLLPQQQRRIPRERCPVPAWRRRAWACSAGAPVAALPVRVARGHHCSRSYRALRAGSASTSASRSHGISVRRSLNDGTTRTSASTTTPSDPSPTDAAANISGCLLALTSTSEALASTSVSETSAVDSEPSLRPVPCVLVCVAPATDCSATANDTGVRTALAW